MTRPADNTLPHFDLPYMRCEANWQRTWPLGRVCVVPACRTVLSRYNPDGFCATHRPSPSLYYCGHRFRLCTGCGKVMEHRTHGTKQGQCLACRSKEGL